MKKISITIILILSLIISISLNIVYAEDENTSTDTNTDTNTNTVEPIVVPEIKGEQSIEDGTYKIISNINYNKVINQVSMNDSNKNTSQKFEIKYVGDGYYKIKNKATNKVLTTESESPNINSKIKQENDQNLDTQKWIIKKVSESIYNIISKCGNLYLEVPNATINNGDYLQLNSSSNSSQQKFVMINQTSTKNMKNITEGVYQIQTKSGKVVHIVAASQDNSKNVMVYNNVKAQNQKFHIIKFGNYYKISAVHSAKVLSVYADRETPNTNVIQYDFTKNDSQQWLFKDCGNGYYNIVSKQSGLYLEVNGSNIQASYNKNNDNQKFKLVGINIINNNTYEIESKKKSSKVIEVKGGSKKSKANVRLYRAVNVNNQRFKFKALNTDTYSIIAKHSGLALTVDKKTNNVYQKKYTGGRNQKWQLIEVGNGYYNFISKYNGLTLAIKGAKAKNGQNIQVEKVTKSKSKQFILRTGFRTFYEEGTYGKSGLAKKGDSRGTKLKYFKIGQGSKAFFATFSIHGFEDSYAHDGKELTYIAEEFKKYLKKYITEDIVNKYTIYVFPCLNPDGQIYGYSHNGPGRTTLYSAAPNHKGIDMNRNWSVGFNKLTNSRNYTGTKAFQAYEAKYLRNFILDHEGSSNILVDTHGWLEETIGDYSLGKYYRKQFGMSKHIYTYGNGYLVNWARTLRKGRSTLVELPEVSKHSQVVDRNYANKWIKATMKMLKNN